MLDSRPQPDPRAELNARLRKLLPRARLSCQAPTALGGRLRLWLIDPAGMAAPLSTAETNAVFEDPPYWSFCWGSGIALAEWMFTEPAVVRGKTVLDFGCGSGVVAIAAALAGASRVIACDLDPLALRATALNAHANGVALDYLHDFSVLGAAVDVLFAADVLYDRDNLPLLQRFRERAATVIVADSRVQNFAESGFAMVGEMRRATVPDLGEPDDVRRVRFYRACSIC
ncbi:MAG: class I SAM-dependent methyltransferase [Porticoccaceae bacterium]